MKEKIQQNNSEEETNNYYEISPTKETIKEYNNVKNLLIDINI